MPTADQQLVVCILGMHRSGTSFLTGSLQQAGLHLGKHHSWNPHNRKGNRENPDIQTLHEMILAHNRGRWDAPPPVSLWSDQHIARAKAIIASFSDAATWGFKDPRTLLVFEGWETLLGQMKLVGIFRHPHSVAASLQTRNAIPIERGMQIWAQYNRRLLDIHRRRAFPLLNFDEDAERLHRSLDDVLMNHLGLAALNPAERFYSDDLRHNRSAGDAANLPDEIAELYELLLARQHKPGA